MFMKKIIMGLILALSAGSETQAQSPAVFKSGDRVVFAGNSITEAGFYESNIWLYYMTHFPDQRITVFNAGIGGDVAGQINNRFEEDVLAKKPSVVVLTFGMNDSGYFEFSAADADETAKQRLEKSFQSFALLQKKLLENPGIKPVIMSSSPYDETMKNKDNYFKGKSKLMEQIATFQQTAAKTNGWAFVDLLRPMTEINIREQKSKPEYTLTGPDRIHPGRAGHLVMSAFFLENQGLAGKPVARILINAKAGTAEAENAKVNLHKKASAAVVFDYLANALPFPIDSVNAQWDNPQKQSDALAVYPFIKNFNQETLQVKNLKKGDYQLMIDGTKISTFSADSLSNGINMALLSNTPQYQQSLSVMYLNDLRAELEKKLRDYYWLQFNFFKGENLLYNDSQQALEKVLAKARTDVFVRSKMGTYQTARFPEVREMWERNIQQLSDRIYQINKPTSHLIEIVAVK
ncbi:hypothetical protein PBAL39_18884 [Pedobacter sp. BAL39]|nr:hypothetical protein PBAL39_18884 [Pedobacter sp. BAL39]